MHFCSIFWIEEYLEASFKNRRCDCIFTVIIFLSNTSNFGLSYGIRIRKRKLMIPGPGFSAVLCDATQKAPEIIFVECYQCVGCTREVARKKPIWCEKTKPKRRQQRYDGGWMCSRVLLPWRLFTQSTFLKFLGCSQFFLVSVLSETVSEDHWRHCFFVLKWCNRTFTTGMFRGGT